MIVTERGDILRSWRADDARAAYEALSEPGMDRQTGGVITDVEAATSWIEHRLHDWKSDRAYSWAVVADSGTLLGSVTVSSVDRTHLTGWTSYWTTPEARGQGVAGSAVRRLATWAFDDLGLFRLELGHRTNNPASCAVARAAGFLVEGIERQKLSYGGERFDVELHARLASDPSPS